ncbi:arylamine N-acetyltransferase family protein [Paenibacillus flagellatus]|uniref:Arylamine N-acetyltransferase n=1 Tax=Paenibacillus flagellatus TaxID=2211139 RepID=A0A2V5KME7_9BACL|nr:arylamine N-acetyltransferase [Paenibacillus flagellatus]PYI56320.1 arylamine N-acetyltransferase [Paenibacillus flagellatus]
MSDFNALFRSTIGFPENRPVDFDALDTVLDKTAAAFPFENLAILSKRTGEITKDRLVRKMLADRQGGLCYELNPLLYLFLIDNGWDAALVRGEVFDHDRNDWTRLGRTHVAILARHEGRTYLVDTGFGTNLALKPIPLDGQAVESRNGEFRVRAMRSDYGNYVLEMKLRHKHTEWRLGYAFDSERTFGDLSEVNEVQRIIVGDDRSPFNKTPLVTRLTADGRVTLTANSLTRWENGVMTKEPVDEGRFRELAREWFGLRLAAGKGDV